VAPALIVWHYTAARSAPNTVSWLCNAKARASAHLVIGSDGTVHQLVPFDRVAWHAGESSWTIGDQLVTGINRYSIGIELDNPGRLVRQGDGWRSLALGTRYDADQAIEARHKHEVSLSGWHIYPQAQLDAAFEVATALLVAYPSIGDVVGHDDVAPRRKSDPGPAFPMEHFRGLLFGRADGAEVS
jgi:N-acetylmuramoyl-L-alanine amidase